MNVKPILIAFLIISLIIPISLSNVSGPSFSVYIGNGAGLGFQNKDQTQVNLTITSGALNCSNASLSIRGDGGLFIFMNNESVTFTVNFDVSKLQVNNLAVSSGGSYSYVANNITRIEWWNFITPYVPLTFLFWIIGMFMCFIGPYMGIKKFKKGEHREGLILITTVCAVGFALVLAGMFSA